MFKSRKYYKKELQVWTDLVKQILTISDLTLQYLPRLTLKNLDEIKVLMNYQVDLNAYLMLYSKHMYTPSFISFAIDNQLLEDIFNAYKGLIECLIDNVKCGHEYTLERGYSEEDIHDVAMETVNKINNAFMNLEQAFSTLYSVTRYDMIRITTNVDIIAEYKKSKKYKSTNEDCYILKFVKPKDISRNLELDKTNTKGENKDVKK